MKLLILYHSGAGNTKRIAYEIKDHLKSDQQVDIYSIEALPPQLNFNEYEGVVIGFPTIHGHPTHRLLAYIEEIAKLEKPLPTYYFTTCGLYSANSLRIMAKVGRLKGFVPVIHHAYRCIATDGILLAPRVRFFQRDEKHLHLKVEQNSQVFLKRIESKAWVENTPPFKLYSLLNYPNKLIGQWSTFPIYLHQESCVGCGKCVKLCPASALERDKAGYPKWTAKQCEKCYRCIHHCPKKALSLYQKRRPSLVLGDLIDREKLED